MVGDQALINAVAEEMRFVYGSNTDVTAKDITVSTGCNMAYVAAVMALASEGDEIILPVPWYFNHQMTNDLLGISTVPLKTTIEEGFLPSPELASDLITTRTRAIALVTPNNPTGATYPPSLIADFAALCRDRKIALILDETYRDFIITGPPHDLFARPHAVASPGKLENPLFVPDGDWSWRSTLIHLFSFSKSYHIPGHRLGILAGAPDLIGTVNTILDCLQICAPAPAQHAFATPGLLSSLRSVVRSDSEELQRRHNTFARALGGGWRLGSHGAYYAFVRHPFDSHNSSEVCERLAKEEGVVSIPDDFFGDKSEGWIRFSVANVDEKGVAEAAQRLIETTTKWEWTRVST